MEDTHTAPHAATMDIDTPQHQRSSSSSSRKDESVPTTPPPSNESGFPDSSYRSPDAYTHTQTILPPVTPSSHHVDSNKFKLGNIPQTPFAGERTPGSPLKSPSQFKDTEEGEKPPIRHLTSKLKTRLNYAFVKYSNGWTNQSLDELERTVVNNANKEREELENKFGSSTAPLTLSPQRPTSTLNGLSASPFNKNKSPSRISKPSSNRSPVRGHRHSMDLMESSGSAHAAFLNAISKSKSPRKLPNTTTSNASTATASPSRTPFRPPPLTIPSTKDTSNESSQSTARSPEAEAIETLMSLSSPQAFKPKLDLPKHNLPRQRLSFGEKIANHESAIATESDTEYEETDDESSPTKDRSLAGRMMDEDDVQTDSEHED